MTVNRGAIAVAAFVSTVAVANVMTATLGLVELPGGAMTSAGTFAAGLALIARDAVQDFAGRKAVAGSILLGAAISTLGAPMMIAIASAAAFAISELLDWAVYSPLARKGRARAVLMSSLAAAPMDTVIFLSLASFPLTTESITGQTVAKVTLAAIAAGVIRAVLRHRKRAARA